MNGIQDRNGFRDLHVWMFPPGGTVLLWLLPSMPMAVPEIYGRAELSR